MKKSRILITVFGAPINYTYLKWAAGNDCLSVSGSNKTATIVILDSKSRWQSNNVIFCSTAKSAICWRLHLPSRSHFGANVTLTLPFARRRVPAGLKLCTGNPNLSMLLVVSILWVILSIMYSRYGRVNYLMKDHNGVFRWPKLDLLSSKSECWCLCKSISKYLNKLRFCFLSE